MIEVTITVVVLLKNAQHVGSREPSAQMVSDRIVDAIRHMDHVTVVETQQRERLIQS